MPVYEAVIERIAKASMRTIVARRSQGFARSRTGSGTAAGFEERLVRHLVRIGGAGLPVDWLPVSERVLVEQLQSRPDGPVSVSGWVETVRDQKKVQFVVLRDETGAVQLVNRRRANWNEEASAEESAALALTETISALTTGTFLTVTGELKHDERVKLGGVEVRIAALEVAASALAETPIAADSGIDKRMDWRFLDLRQRRNALIFRVQTTLEHAMRSY